MLRSYSKFVKKVYRRISLLTDKRWLRFYLQRLILCPKKRDRIAETYMTYFRSSLKVNPLLSEGITENKTLHESGIVRFNAILSSTELNETVTYLADCKVQDPYDLNAQSFYPNEVKEKSLNCHIAHYRSIDIINAPHLLKLANNPVILNLATHFLGCKPTLGYMAVWWSYPTNIGPQQAEIFHRDVDDWKFVKLFVYLSDVDRDTGPHVYVKGSARCTKLLKIKRFSDQEISQVFPESDILTLVSNAGDGFLENTFGLHRGMPLKKGSRLMFQAVYSLMPLPYGPKKPLAKMADLVINIDPWINRVYIKS